MCLLFHALYVHGELMRDVKNLICQIPARAGSQRVRAKNLRYLGDRPLLAYAIAAARQSGVCSRVIVNTDGEDLAALAHLCGAEVYRRPAELASDTASGDDFNADFLATHDASSCMMISPVCPFVDVADIRAAVARFAESDADTLISCQETSLQTFCRGLPVNIDLGGPLAPTQNNAKVQILNWAVTIWDRQTFLESYARSRSGYIGTKRCFFPIAPLHALKISNESDFELAQCLMTRSLPGSFDDPRYWNPADGKCWDG
jgi:CMP-N-acetylneuraminic acid synthetase